MYDEYILTAAKSNQALSFKYFMQKYSFEISEGEISIGTPLITLTQILKFVESYPIYCYCQIDLADTF